MTFLSSLFIFANQILTFYLPVFFTFKFLASHDPQKISRILKFWCVLTICYIIQYVFSFILADNLDIIVDLLLHVVLIYDEFNYSQEIYDKIIKNVYKNNEETIHNLTKQLEEYYEKKASQVQSQVSRSAADKVRGFIGQILVGTLNPANKKKEVEQDKRSNEDQEDSEKDD